jgi:lipopolysaccharide/colanic/teichoic acid biosynthesis glycosyltransferase
VREPATQRADVAAAAASDATQSARQTRATRDLARDGHETVDIDLVELERREATLDGQRESRGADRPDVDRALLAAREATAPKRSFLYTAVKRTIDVAIASVALVVFSPVVALLAAAIRLDSRGPAIFRQTRVGKNGELFRFYKFRTMYVDARERFPDLYAYDYSDEDITTMYFKLPYDPRCTRVGRWLRRTSLDELPNLVNVLKGSMTMVGPRPEIPEMLPFYEPHQYCKFAVKPGVTGLAQVSGRNILRFVETNAKDVEYVNQRSTRLDCMILIRTIGAVLMMVGAH